VDSRALYPCLALAVAALAGGCDRFGWRGRGSSAGGGPDQVVHKFLEAVRVGDQDEASRLLTPLACKRTAEMDMVVAPPGSAAARFEIVSTRDNGQTAGVTADWTDLDASGQPHTDRIEWLLRHEADGWRISGMATKVFADEEPIVLNFEDPAEMLAKQQQAEEKMAQRERQQAAQPKTRDGSSSGAVR
jgi:hypothetical protein